MAETCSRCSGSGAEPGTSKSTCPTCHGRGQVSAGGGFIQFSQTCPTCGGTGETISSPCRACNGAGSVKQRKTIKLKIPAGVESGSRQRLPGKGEAGARGGPAGDLFIVFHVRDHELFKRSDLDIYCEVPVPFTLAAMGGELEIPTLDGQVKLKIPSETQTGRMFRLKGKGVKSVRSHRTGDLMCRVVLETPVKLTREQKDLLRQFEDTLTAGNDKHNPRSQNWLKGVREFFDRMTS